MYNHPLHIAKYLARIIKEIQKAYFTYTLFFQIWTLPFIIFHFFSNGSKLSVLCEILLEDCFRDRTFTNDFKGAGKGSIDYKVRILSQLGKEAELCILIDIVGRKFY